MHSKTILAGAALICLMTGGAGGARADIITDWNATTLKILQAQQSDGSAGSRALAIVHVAMSDAVNTVQNKYTRYAARMPVDPQASAEAAAAAAARRALSELYPKQAAAIDEAYAAAIKAIPDGAAKQRGIALGEQSADAVLAERASDGTSVPDTYRPITSPGVWVPTAPPITEQFSRARPWVMTSASQFRPGPPPTLTSTLYARDYNETKSLGARDSKARSAEQTAAVAFWRTPVLAPAWHAAAGQLASEKNLPLSESARLFALLSMASATSFIADWDAKFTYNFWRPVTAIRNGDVDNNDLTERDAGWSPMAPTPMHPEYPSQASISAGVSLGVIEAVLGKNPGGAFTATDFADPKRTRTVTSLAAMAEEHRNVRVWGGIHFRNSLDVAQDMGARIGGYVVENAMKPVR